MKPENTKHLQLNTKNGGLFYCMEMIGGKWKPLILFNVSKGTNRFNKLFDEIAPINRQMLSKQLKELETSGILHRTLFPEIPPRVEYTLTPLGTSLLPIILSMNKWGQKQQQGAVSTPTKRATTQQLPLFE